MLCTTSQKAAFQHSQNRRMWAVLVRFLCEPSRDSRGATAVEFGLVCAPFLALLGAIVQTAFSIWAAQNFEYQFQRTVRALFTGQFQQNNAQSASSSTLLSAIKTSMCGSGSTATLTVFDCSNLKIDISIGTNFASLAPVYPLDPTTKDWSPNFGNHYACAGPSTIVIATAATKFPVFFGALNLGFSSFADGSQLLESTAVFRTEPYTAGASPC